MDKQTKANKLVYSLLSISATLFKVGNRITKEYDLTQQQFVTLNKIVTVRIINQKELTSTLLFEKSNISKIVKKLLSRNYISVEKNKNDARITTISPTDKGIKLWEEIVLEYEKWNIEFVSSLNPKELDDSIVIAEKLNNLILGEF